MIEENKKNMEQLIASQTKEQIKANKAIDKYMGD